MDLEQLLSATRTSLDHLNAAAQPILPIIDLVFDQVIVLLIAYVLALKAFNLTRRTTFGWRITDLNLAFAFIYLMSFIGGWVVFFRSDPWRYIIRTLLFVAVMRVLLEMKWTYGGWIPLHKRAARGAISYFRREQPDFDGSNEGY